MDLTKEAIDKIEDLVTQSVVVEVDGKKMSTRDLYPVAFEAVAHPLNVSSLTGFVDFVNRNIDKLDLNANYIAVVTDVYKVSLTSALFGIRKNREILIDAILDSRMESFPFGRFLPQEDFIIKLHSLFQKKEDDDFEYVSALVSKIKQADSADTEDDGITQNITVKRGVSGALVGKENVKPIVRLSPYRAFREIEQPESQFLLRIKTEDGIPHIALFEADGGQWRNEARVAIAEFLKANIKVAVIA
ncbi:hypothetical protein E4N89_06255 [Treponema denticola]|uniref:hypothetical protein n=1 Tax=Treponema denticola TaxID=158 RepID=UPI003D94779D